MANGTVYKIKRTIYEGNKSGSDYFFGDLHGCLDEFKSFVKKSNPGDRFFVVGDLIDKGKQSYQVLKYVAAHKDSVFAIRGNHEEDMYWLLFRLQRCIHTQQQTIIETMKKCRELWQNGNQKAKNKQEAINNKLASLSEKGKPDPLLYGNIINGGGWIWDLDNQQRDEVRKWIEDLPHEICVKEVKNAQGETIRSARASHAMPSDDEFDWKQQPGVYTEPIDDFENYSCYRLRVLCARPGEEKFKIRRKKDNTLTYVGHNILPDKGIHSFLIENKVVCLDTGFYVNKVQMVVNHTNNQLIVGRGCRLQEYNGERLTSLIDTNVKIISEGAKKECTTLMCMYASFSHYHNQFSSQLLLQQPDTLKWKKAYLALLQAWVIAATQEDCICFMKYLLTEENNPLAYERHYALRGVSYLWGRGKQYTNNTRSMSKATSILMDAIKRKATEGPQSYVFDNANKQLTIGQVSCFFTRHALNLSDTGTSSKDDIGSVETKTVGLS